MTTLIMPSDYGMEMLVGSSPVMGSGFLGGSPYYNEYNRCAPMWSHTAPVSRLTSEAAATTIAAKAITNPAAFGFTVNSNFAEGPPRTTGLPSQTLFSRVGSFRNVNRNSMRRRKLATVEAPLLQHLNLKSCLINRADDQLSDGLTSPTKEKKKVSFADMTGGNLTQIKIITENPDCPPRWSQEFLDQVTGGAKAEAVPDEWALTFSQPAADYITWKAKLERDFVALENIVIKEAEAIMCGTIKVRNISFHKEVTLRYTIDNWLSNEDVQAMYVSFPASGSSYNLYDTFSFEVPLPSSNYADKIEFCLSYTAGGQQFWDNNNDKNYAVVSFRSQKSLNNDRKKPSDLYDVKMASWSEFSAWNNLETTDSPYW